MAAAHGHLHPFDSSVEDWSTFIERAELYFIANDITEDAKKRGVLLSCCGPKTFTMIKSIVAPKKPVKILIMTISSESSVATTTPSRSRLCSAVCLTLAQERKESHSRFC